jgi:preprotein translocase subunit SecG
MTVLLSILAILFLILVVGIPLLEKYSAEKSDEELGKMTRYMSVLMAVLIIGMAIRYFIG